MPKNETLKFCIEKIKLDTGLRQAEIADKIDVKSTYLSDMINGRVPLTESVCQKISEVFHISIPTNTDCKYTTKPQQYYGGESEQPATPVTTVNETANMERLLGLLEAKEASLAKAQQHIDKLLEIIANQTK